MLLLLAAVLAAAPAAAGTAMDSLKLAAENAGSSRHAEAFDGQTIHIVAFYPAQSTVGGSAPDAPVPAPTGTVPAPQIAPAPSFQAPQKRQKPESQGLPVQKAQNGMSAVGSAQTLLGAIASLPIFAAVIGPAAYAVGAVVAVGLSAVVVQTSYDLYKLVF